MPSSIKHFHGTPGRRDSFGCESSKLGGVRDPMKIMLTDKFLGKWNDEESDLDGNSCNKYEITDRVVTEETSVKWNQRKLWALIILFCIGKYEKLNIVATSKETRFFLGSSSST